MILYEPAQAIVSLDDGRETTNVGYAHGAAVDRARL